MAVDPGAGAGAALTRFRTRGLAFKLVGTSVMVTLLICAVLSGIASAELDSALQTAFEIRGDIITVPHAGIVYALGAVNRAGGFVVTGDRAQMTTLKVLALAGGVSRTASLSRAVLVRKDAQGKQTEVMVDLKKVMRRETEDVPMRPSDVLYIPDSGTKQVLIKALEVGVGIGTAAAIFRVAYH